MRAVRFLAITLVMLSLAGGLVPAQASTRMALLIGNAAYPDSDAVLPTPVADAQALGEELARHGFTVEVADNLTGEALKAALDRFAKRVEPGAVTFVFFAGYGIQVTRRNYLIPVDARIWSEADVLRDGIAVDGLMTDLEKRGARTRVLVLDASRRNPFERRFRSFSTGLAPAKANAGSLTLYSAAAGSVVNEGSARRSLFVTELVKQIGLPDRTAEQAFSGCRETLSKATRNQQNPALASGLEDGFSFDPNRPTQPVAQPKPPEMAAVKPAPVEPVEVKPLPPAPASPPEPARPEPPAATEIPPPPAPEKPSDTVAAKPAPVEPTEGKPSPAPSPDADAPLAKPEPPEKSVEASEAPAAPAVQPPAEVKVPVVEAPTVPEPASPPPARADDAPSAVAGKDVASKEVASKDLASKDLDAPLAAEQEAVRAFNAANGAGSKQAYRDFIERYPNGSLAARARAEIARLDAAEQAKAPILAEPKPYTEAERKRKAALDQRIAKSPRDALAYYERGQFYAQRNEAAPAIADFDQSIRIDPNQPDALNNRCWMRAVSGDLRRALSDCNAALKLRRDFVNALDSRGFVNLKLGEYRAALTDYEAALRADAAHGSALYGRGMAKRRLGEIASGDRDLAAALELNPSIDREFAQYGLR